jgi:hypothetical protein
VDEYWDHLARINCVLDQAALELDEDKYLELLAQVQSEVLDRLPSTEDGEEDSDRDEDSDNGCGEEELD